MDNTVKGRERKSWRGSSGTSDYKAGYEKALLTARNLQSERDRVVNVLRNLSNESVKGKQYGLTRQRSKDCAGFPSVPSEWGALHQCQAPFEKLRIGPGWGPANAGPVNGIYNGPTCLPIPMNTVYVGFGNQEIFRRPSPWSILLRTSPMTINKPIGSLLSLGVPGLTEFNGCLQFWGSSLHVIAVRAMSGAMAVWTMHCLSIVSDLGVESHHRLQSGKKKNSGCTITTSSHEMASGVT